MHKLKILLGLATLVAAVTNGWNIDLPQMSAKHGRAHAARHAPPWMLQQPHQSSHAQDTVLQRVPEQPPKPSVTDPRYPAIAFNGTTPPPLPNEELEILTALYHSLGGPDWSFNDGWLNVSNPCGSGITGDSWYGVECTVYETAPPLNYSSHVTGLVLPQNNLVGKLPTLSGLKYLNQLDISNNVCSPDVPTGLLNAVSGTLDALCGLGNLSTALLTCNKISGSIPACVQSWSKATLLNFNYNAIQGTTPNELCRLNKLEELRLQGNQLQGTVPMCFGQAMPALRVLDYSNFDAEYNIGSQLLSGTLPASLCDLEHLEMLLFQGTQGLHGTIPDCLGAKQPQLQALAFQNNLFQGSLPPKICQESTLEYLLLGDNQLTGTLPSCFGSLKQLIILDLDTNNFHGTMPEELCQASALEGLYLFGNFMTGTLPTCLGSLNEIYDLELNNNRFHGSMPDEFCRASALEFLILFNNDLTGTLPSCLGNLSQLIALELESNQFSGRMPEGLCQASALELIWLYDNALTGSLPNCLFTSFPLVESMLLHNNDFNGAVPSRWALPSLISIMLSNNPKLSGKIPPSLFLEQDRLNASTSISSANDVLRAVVIEGTSIGGSLPAALCSAPQLVILAISGNEITGSLPSCLVSLQKLETLRVSNNRLTGTLPEALLC